MQQEFEFDVFVCYSSSDWPVVLDLAKRLRADGVRVWLNLWEIQTRDWSSAKIEYGLQHSRLLLLCVSANALGADWVTLENQTFRFRDPLNKERRMVLVRLDDVEIQSNLTQFMHLDWRRRTNQAFDQLRELCKNIAQPDSVEATTNKNNKKINLLSKNNLSTNSKLFGAAFAVRDELLLRGGENGNLELWEIAPERLVKEFLDYVDWTDRRYYGNICCVALSPNKEFAASGEDVQIIRLWQVKTGKCLGVLKGHTSRINSVVFSPDGGYLLSTSDDNTMRLWDIANKLQTQIFRGHTSFTSFTCSAIFSPNGHNILSSAEDNTLRLWDRRTGLCIHKLKGHKGRVTSVALNNDGTLALSGSLDKTLRLWDIVNRTCLQIFEGHTNAVISVAINNNGHFAASCSWDHTVRLWDTTTGKCLYTSPQYSNDIEYVTFSTNQSMLLSVSANSQIGRLTTAVFLPNFKGLSQNLADNDTSEGQSTWLPSPPAADLQYTNAKVLIVGDSGAGKTGLTERLAANTFTITESTAGAWATQWKLDVPADVTTACQREIWLWDFGGQADQRLIHQLFIDQAALILLMFNADKEDVLPGLHEWQTALFRCLPDIPSQLLVAGRTDVGFKASRAKLQKFAADHGFGYFETSAKSGIGCPELRNAITKTIDWGKIPRRSSPVIFKQIKDVILQLRDEKQVLHTFKELYGILERRLPSGASFDTAILETVINLLDGPGVIKQLDYGSYILLQPEWINAYAQAVIRTLRADERELGALPLGAISEGKLLFQSMAHNGTATIEMQRLPQDMERIVLREMEKQLEERFLCLRQDGKLIFPSHCGRERPTAPTLPCATHSYSIQGYLDDIYATLVVKLAQSEAFTIDTLWRDAADFKTLGKAKSMGIRLLRENAGRGQINVFFDKEISNNEQIIFANYIHTHLNASCEEVTRERNYVCAHCGETKNSSPAIRKKLERDKKQARASCDNCDKPIPLWDEQEERFASEEVRALVEEMQAREAINLSAIRKGKLLTLEVAARISSCDHKCHEIPQPEDEGIDMVLEFTEPDGKGNNRGSGKNLYLQLKSGNSHLTRRKNGKEIFSIKKREWVDSWCIQPGPVMLVIGTFPEDERSRLEESSGKLKFEEVRWMEISSVLKAAKQKGKTPTQIEFKGERMDMTSIQKWRDKMLKP